METLIGIKEAAARLGVSSRTVTRLVVAQQLPVIRIGRRVLFRVADLDAFVDRRSSGTAVRYRETTHG